jgi:hypothetical protein
MDFRGMEICKQGALAQAFRSTCPPLRAIIGRMTRCRLFLLDLPAALELLGGVGGRNARELPCAET